MFRQINSLYPLPPYLFCKIHFKFCCVMPPLETLPPPGRSEWGSILPPDCFVSRGSISPMGISEKFCFSRGGVVSASPNPQAGGPPLVGCPRQLIQYIRSYPPYRRPFLHPQPEDAPCRGDRDPQYIYSIVKTQQDVLYQNSVNHLQVQPN